MPANTRRASAADESMPYRYDDGVDLGVTGFSFDGGEAGSPDYDDRVLPLHEYGPWEVVEIDVSVTLDPSVARVFPDDEGPPFPAEPVVVVDCEETQTRYAVSVGDDHPPVELETFETTVELERDLFRGTVRLTPRLVRTEPCASGLPYAPNEGMRVAGGGGWTVRVDDPPEDHDGFPFVYRDFSQESMPPVELAHSLSRHPEEKMMINDQHEGIVDVMQSGLTSGFRPNLKRFLKADFGVMLWVQLVLWTGTTVAETGTTEFDWQAGVVQELATHEFGDHLFDSDADYDTVERELGRRVDDPSELRDFVGDLFEAAQLYTEYGRQLERFVDREAP